MVQDVESALQVLVGTVRALTKDKSTQKANYFRAEAERNFLPDPNTRVIKSEQAASVHVSNAFRLWSRRMEIPVADANIIMNVLGSLEKIMEADERILDDIPVASTTKSKLLQFFNNTKTTKKSYNYNQSLHFERQNHDYELNHDVRESKDCNISKQFLGSNHEDYRFFAPSSFDVQTQVHQSSYEQHQQPRRIQESHISHSQGISRIFQQRAMTNNLHLHDSESGIHSYRTQPMNQFKQSRAVMRMQHPQNYAYMNNPTLMLSMNNYHQQQQFGFDVDHDGNQLSHLEWSNNSNSNCNGYLY